MPRSAHEFRDAASGHLGGLIWQKSGTPIWLLTGLTQPPILPSMSAVRPHAGRLRAVRAVLPPALGRRWVGFLFLLLLTVGIADPALAVQARAKSPSKPKGITHIVSQGQTLFRISQAYGVSVASLAEANRLKPSQPPVRQQ